MEVAHRHLESERVIRVLYTVGHSTHSVDEFISLLGAHEIQRVVDIRTVPRSRRNPQFNRDAMPAVLEPAGIAYTHLAGLGGLRHPKKDSINTGWKNDSFRGYADYMQTDEFVHNIDELATLAQAERVAIMCAEAVPWRCHRSLVADAMKARGWEVRHILSAAPAKPHNFTPFARVEGARITYPGLPVPTAE
jgi:uncharacterized protein (DUF488 family)